MELKDFIISQTENTYTFLLYHMNNFTVEMIGCRIVSNELSDLIPFVIDVPGNISEILMGDMYGFSIRCGDIHGMIDTYILRDGENVQELIYRGVANYKTRWDT